MPKPMTVVDVGHLADHPGDESPATGLTPVERTAHSAWSLLRVAPLQRWTAPDADREERSVLVLDGMATFLVDGWRQSLGSGHLLVVEPGAALEVHNEGAAPLVALLTWSPPPSGARPSTELETP